MSITGKGVRFKRRSGSPWYLSILLLTEVVLSLFVYATLAANVIWPRGTQGAAGVANVLSYEGRLTDASGNALGGAGTDYCFKFSIYDASTAGSKVWPSGSATGQSITVTDGVFDALIGTADTLDYNFFDNDTVYLNVDVATKVGASCTNGDETYESVTPRQRIAAVGYAFSAANVYSSLLKTDNANDKVQIGTGTGATSPKLLALDVRNSSDTIGSACSVSGSLWYNSVNNRALVCDNSTIQEIGNLATIVGIKEASAGSAISSGTVVWSGINGVSISQDAQTMSISGLNAFGVSNIGNTVGNTGVQTGTLVFSGQGNITLSQVTGAGGVHTLGISAGGAVAPTLDYYLNKPGAGAASVNQAFSNATMAIFPLNGGEVFPGNITANTIQLMLSGNITATASSSSNTQSYSIGFYTMNASTLSLAFSASSSFAVGAATSNTALSHGPRFLTFHSSQFNVQPTFSQASYWVAVWQRSSNFAAQASWMGHRMGTSNQISGTWGVSAATANSFKWFPYWGHYGTSFSTAMPANITKAQIVGASAWTGFSPYILFNDYETNF